MNRYKITTSRRMGEVSSKCGYDPGQFDRDMECHQQEERGAVAGVPGLDDRASGGPREAEAFVCAAVGGVFGMTIYVVGFLLICSRTNKQRESRFLD